MSHKSVPVPQGLWGGCRATPMPLVLARGDSSSSLGLIPQECLVYRPLPPTPEQSVCNGGAAPRRGDSIDSESTVTDGAYEVVNETGVPRPPGLLAGPIPRGYTPRGMSHNDSVSSQYTDSSGRSLISDRPESWANMSQLENLSFITPTFHADKNWCLCRRTYVFIFVFIYTFLLLMTMCFCAWFYVNYHGERVGVFTEVQRLQQDTFSPKVCVPCQKLARGTDDRISLIQTYTDRKICKVVHRDLTKPLNWELEGRICTNNATEITELMESVVAAEFGRDFHLKQVDLEEKIAKTQDRLNALGLINGSDIVQRPTAPPEPQSTTPSNKPPTPLAHVVGKCRDQEETECKIKWEDDSRSSQAFNLQGGVTLDNGYLLTPASGFYYVYSQVCFDAHTTQLRARAPGGQSHVTFEHSIQRNCAIRLSDHSHTMFQNLKQINLQGNHEHCSYLGGVIRMNRGCGVHVQVGAGHFLSTNKHMNYFGLYQIPATDQI